jgi:hypothetical protein
MLRTSRRTTPSFSLISRIPPATRSSTALAKTAYQDFFSLWKDADLDIPILKKVKAEYAKLQ